MVKNYTSKKEKLHFLCNDMINSNIKCTCFVVGRNRTFSIFYVILSDKTAVMGLS